MTDSEAYKMKNVVASGKSSAFNAYRCLYYGKKSLPYVVKAEIITLLFSGIPGALGLILRKWFYPSLFRQCGHGVVFGRNVTLRHAHKISLGDHVVVDDNSVLDAKGDTNDGIRIGARAYIGRNTIVYCKNGDIVLGDAVNISSNCQLFSSHRLEIGRDTVVAAFTYILSGGRYDYRQREVPFAAQPGTLSRGATRIGENCWIGAGVVVMDGASTGSHCVVGASAVVTGVLPGDCVATGIPALVSRSL